MKPTDPLNDRVPEQKQQLVLVSSSEDTGTMGCRFKDIVYISVILLLGLGVWTGLSKDNVIEDDEWPWSMGHVETGETYLQTDGDLDDGYYDGGDADDDHGLRLSVDGADQGGFNSDVGGAGDMAFGQNADSPHLPLDEDIVHGDNHIVESSEDQQPLDSNQLLMQYQAQNAAPIPDVPGDQSGNVNTGLLNMARQILISHVAENGQGPQNPADVVADVQEINGKPAPKLIFKSHRTARDVSSHGNAEPKMPRIIHQSWESTDIPSSFSRWVKSWLEKNPGWEYWFWTPADVRALVSKDYPKYLSMFDSLSTDDKANVLRYFIIHAHGGFYAELDMECLNSVDTWIYSHGCFLAEEAREHSYLVHNKVTGNVINAIMACKAHHPFYEVVIHALPDYVNRYRSDPKRATGSFFLDDIYKAFQKHPLPPSLAQYGDVAMIEPDYFIPSYNTRHWDTIDKACNSNIQDMPFHVSWLCTLWIRKRMHENAPYEQSYTDHHWVDPADVGAGNMDTVPVNEVIQEALAAEKVEAPPTQPGPDGIPESADMNAGFNMVPVPAQNEAPVQLPVELPNIISAPELPQNVPALPLPVDTVFQDGTGAVNIGVQNGAPLVPTMPSDIAQIGQDNGVQNLANVPVILPSQPSLPPNPPSQPSANFPVPDQQFLQQPQQQPQFAQPSQLPQAPQQQQVPQMLPQQPLQQLPQQPLPQLQLPQQIPQQPLPQQQIPQQQLPVQQMPPQQLPQQQLPLQQLPQQQLPQQLPQLPVANAIPQQAIPQEQIDQQQQQQLLQQFPQGQFP